MIRKQHVSWRWGYTEYRHGRWTLKGCGRLLGEGETSCRLWGEDHSGFLGEEARGRLWTPHEQVEWGRQLLAKFVEESQKSGSVLKLQGIGRGPLGLGALAFGAAWRQGREGV